MSFLYRLVRKAGKLGRAKTLSSPLAADVYEGFGTERTPLSTETTMKPDQRHSKTCLICLNAPKLSESCVFCAFSGGCMGEDSEYVMVESSITRSNHDDQEDEEFVIVEKGGKAPGKKASTKGKISRGTLENLRLEELLDLYPPNHLLDMLSSYESTIPEEVTKSSEKNYGGIATFTAKNTYFRPFVWESRHDYSKMSYCWEHWPGTGGTLCEKRASCFECY